MNRFLRPIGAGLAGFALLSCGGGGSDSPTAPLVLTTLTISLPTATIQVGQSSSATAAGLDQNGAPIATGAVTWSTGSTTIATVTADGLVTGAGAGQTQIIASAGGKQAQTTVTVNPAVVTTVVVVPPNATVGAGDTYQLQAGTFDANGGILTGRPITWASSDDTKATVSQTGLVTGVASGQATITASSEGKSGTSLITINSCNSSSALQLTVGQVYTLSAAEKAALCLGGGASASEYALIAFNSTNVASAMINVQLTGANTAPILPGSLALVQPGAAVSGLRKPSLSRSFELGFRERERTDLARPFASLRQLSRAQRLAEVRRFSAPSRDLSSLSISALPTEPVVGTTYQINAGLGGNSCNSAKQLRGAVAVAVLPHVIVLSDVTSPAGGWTQAEMAAFGQAFEDTGYPLGVANFGAPSDIDANGRVVILYTPSVNALPAGGLTAYRDLFPVSECPASNEGEMFYMPVPDPNNTINTFFSDKPSLARFNLSVLIHEFQHLINGGRRVYVNDAFEFEEIWLNEGLSHIAEELYYYQASGNSPRQNIDLVRLRSSQAQLDAVNAGQVGNLGRLSDYMQATETSTPFDAGDASETRGSIWQLLRYSADRTGGADQPKWFAMVNSREAGQTNFNVVFGNIITLMRDWAVAQFTDDSGLGVAANHTHPSWNYRSVLPAINSNAFPLFTRALSTDPVNITLRGGGAAYVRFRIAASVAAPIAANSSGQPVPAAVEFILIRTQ